VADALERVVARLEEAAATLRAGDLPPERAAALVEECARLAAEGAAELDREVRAGEAAGPAPGQMAFE
jgi:hypothetical protein